MCSLSQHHRRKDSHYLYYLNKTDLTTQIDNATSKIERNTIYDDNKLHYKEFLDFIPYIKEILYDNKNLLNYDIRFITQDNSDIGYSFKDTKIFIDSYKDFHDKI